MGASLLLALAVVVAVAGVISAVMFYLSGPSKDKDD